MTSALRGQIYSVDLGGDKGRHWYVIVSNNIRNRNLKSVLGAMITSTDKSHIPTAVPLTHEDSISGGYVLADEIEPLYENELDQLSGVVSPATMTKLNIALKVALALK